jgi:predicted hotdog family 3-hydroxylacyl-ACP dehydratase
MTVSVSVSLAEHHEVRATCDVSHSPAEYAEPEGCLAGMGELARVVQGLLG